MADYLADNATDIAKRWAEIQEEKRQAVMGKPLEEPKPEVVEVGWPYGVYTSGYQLPAGTMTQEQLYQYAANWIKDRDEREPYAGAPTREQIKRALDAQDAPSPDFRSLYNKACQEIASRNAKD